MQTGFERTLVLLKPDAVQRRLIGRILQRFEQKGLAIVALKLVQVTDALAREQYAVHEGKEFYEPLVKFLGRMDDFAVDFRFTPEGVMTKVSLKLQPEK